MSDLKGGPKWRVTQVWPRAHALQQQRGGWKVYTGDYATGNQVIGDGAFVAHAWLAAAEGLDKAAKER